MASPSLDEVRGAFEKALKEYQPDQLNFNQGPRPDPIKLDPVFGWILLITAIASVLVVVIVLIIRSIDKNKNKVKVTKSDLETAPIVIDPIKIVGDELLPISKLLVGTLESCVKGGLSVSYETNTLKELDVSIKQFFVEKGLGEDIGLYENLVYHFLRVRFRGDLMPPAQFENLSLEIEGLRARIEGGAP